MLNIKTLEQMPKKFLFNSQVTIKIIVMFSEFISYCLYNIFFVFLKSPKKETKIVA